MGIMYDVYHILLCVFAKGCRCVAEVITARRHTTFSLVRVHLLFLVDPCCCVDCLICPTSMSLGHFLKLFSCCPHMKSVTSWNKRLSLVDRLFTRHVDALIRVHVDCSCQRAC